MKLWLFLTTLTAALTIPVVAVAQTQTPSLPYSYYTITVTLNTSRHALIGEESITYFNDSQSPLPAVYFTLEPNYSKSPNPYLSPFVLDQTYPDGLDPAWLKIDSVKDTQGAKLSYDLLRGPATFQTYSLEDTLMRVTLAQPLAPGARTTLVIDFATKFPDSLAGDEAYHNEIYTWRFSWQPEAVPASELVNGAYPTDPQPYPKAEQPSAFYELTLTIPQDYEAAIGADHQEVIRKDEDQKTKTIHAISATPTRSIPVSIGKDYQHYTLEHPEMPIEVYYLPGDEAAARLIATYAAESLDYYRSHWGEYPHYRLLLAESASPDAQFEGASSDALAILNSGLFSDKDLAVPGLIDRWIDQIVAHEIAHQWWGIGIGSDLNAENFLSESFAQYFSITYFEQKYGANGGNVFQPGRDGLLERFVKSQFGYINLRQHLEGDLPYITAFNDRFDEAIVKPLQQVRYANDTAERLYNKGYLVLRALRGLLGKAKMDELLAAGERQYLHRTMTVENFRTLAEEVAGRDLSLFFEDWLYRDQDAKESGQAPYIDLSVDGVTSILQPDGQYQNEIILTRRGSIRMPAKLVARSASGHTYDGTWEAADQNEHRFTMLITTDSPIVEVQLDPDSWIPDINRLNNTWVRDELFGRKLDVILTGDNALPLDAYMIRVDPVRQLVEGGFLLDHRWWIGNGIAGFDIDLHRDSSLAASIDLLGAVAGEIQWTKTFYSWPVTGSPGRYWQPSDLLKLSLVRRSDASGHPLLDEALGAKNQMITYLDLSWQHQETLNGLYGYGLALLDDPFSFQRVEAAGSIGLWLAPQASLEASVSGGLGQNLSGLFRFTLDELQSFGPASGYPFPGNVKLSGQIAFAYPLQREMHYDALGLVAFERADERLYLKAANTWERLSDVRLDDLKVEAGFEVTASGQTFGGLFPFAITLGFAYPVVGFDGQERQIREYFGISTPLL